MELVVGDHMKISKYLDWGVALLSAIAGPPVGSLFVLLSLVSDLAELWSALVAFITTLPAAYVLGLPSSILAGLLFGIVWRIWPARMMSGWLICAVAGSMTGALGVFLSAAMLSWPGSISDFFYYRVGIGSGAICALFVRYRKSIAQRALRTDAP